MEVDMNNPTGLTYALEKDNGAYRRAVMQRTGENKFSPVWYNVSREEYIETAERLVDHVTDFQHSPDWAYIYQTYSLNGQLDQDALDAAEDDWLVTAEALRMDTR